MPKFNKNMIKGAEQQDNGTGGIRVGAGLLNDASKGRVKMKIEHIPRSLIDKNEKNQYSIEGIESLAWSIREMGLLQPVHLMQKEDGRYEILGGERRITAIDRLIEDPDVEEWDSESLIPAVVKGIESIRLPLTDELKERFSILTTNKESRKYTDGDRLLEIREWKEIIHALRDAGVEKIPGIDEEGNETDIQIQGEKTREILTRTTGLSRGTVNAFEKVENQGAADLREALLNNSVTLTTAKHLIEKAGTKEEQKEMLDRLKEQGKEVTPGTIDEELARREQEKAEGREGTEITASAFRKDIREVTKLLKKGGAWLDDAALMRYYGCIRELEKLLAEGEIDA